MKTILNLGRAIYLAVRTLKIKNTLFIAGATTLLSLSAFWNYAGDPTPENQILWVVFGIALVISTLAVITLMGFIFTRFDKLWGLADEILLLRGHFREFKLDEPESGVHVESLLIRWTTVCTVRRDVDPRFLVIFLKAKTRKSSVRAAALEAREHYLDAEITTPKEPKTEPEKIQTHQSFEGWFTDHSGLISALAFAVIALALSIYTISYAANQASWILWIIGPLVLIIAGYFWIRRTWKKILRFLVWSAVAVAILLGILRWWTGVTPVQVASTISEQGQSFAETSSLFNRASFTGVQLASLAVDSTVASMAQGGIESNGEALTYLSASEETAQVADAMNELVSWFNSLPATITSLDGDIPDQESWNNQVKVNQDLTIKIIEWYDTGWSEDGKWYDAWDARINVSETSQDVSTGLSQNQAKALRDFGGNIANATRSLQRFSVYLQSAFRIMWVVQSEGNNDMSSLSADDQGKIAAAWANAETELGSYSQYVAQANRALADFAANPPPEIDPNTASSVAQPMVNLNSDLVAQLKEAAIPGVNVVTPTVPVAPTFVDPGQIAQIPQTATSGMVVTETQVLQGEMPAVVPSTATPTAAQLPATIVLLDTATVVPTNTPIPSATPQPVHVPQECLWTGTMPVTYTGPDLLDPKSQQARDSLQFGTRILGMQEMGDQLMLILAVDMQANVIALTWADITPCTFFNSPNWDYIVQGYSEGGFFNIYALRVSGTNLLRENILLYYLLQ